MAPIMTAVEFTFKPREAMKIAKTKIHKLVPLKGIELSILSVTLSWSSFSYVILNC